jgi:hypothetical protein
VDVQPSADARAELARWQEDYIRVRPHSATGNLAPAVYASICNGGAPVMQRERALELCEGSAPAPLPPLSA